MVGNNLQLHGTIDTVSQNPDGVKDDSTGKRKEPIKIPGTIKTLSERRSALPA